MSYINKILAIQLIMLLLIGGISGQVSRESITVFRIQDINGSQYLESCIGHDMYKEKFKIPLKANNYDKDKSYYANRTIDDSRNELIHNSHWQGDCLYIKINDFKEIEIKQLILSFSDLNLNQIQLIHESTQNK